MGTAVFGPSASLSSLSTARMAASGGVGADPPSAHLPHPGPKLATMVPMTLIHTFVPCVPFRASMPPVMPKVAILASQYILADSSVRAPWLRISGCAAAVGRSMLNRGRLDDRYVRDCSGMTDGSEGTERSRCSIGGSRGDAAVSGDKARGARSSRMTGGSRGCFFFGG